MKRLCILIGVVFLFISALAFAETNILIDFSNLTADVSLSGGAAPTENEATLVDFSGVAGSSFDEQLRKQMKTSLAIENWEVQLSSSSRTVGNQSKSFTREAMTRPDAPDFQGQTMGGIVVMGVRVHFPLPTFNSFAVIKPPFEIPAYSMKTELQANGELTEVEGDLGTKFDGYGVIKNVGVIKSVEVTVYGSNFPNGFGIILKNQDEVEQNIFMDYLEFDGWKTLVWNNPNYITEVRNREIRKYPLYPKSEPFTKLVGLILYRDSMQEGGDIITYIKDIKVTYDKAVLRPERDIDDEAIWGILSERQEARKAAELRRLGNLQVLRFLEQQKMHEEETE
jgi:hypothetical protein